MEAQPLGNPIITKLTEQYNPHPSLFSQLEAFLKESKGSVQSMTEILTALEAAPRTQINYDSFCKVGRLLRRAILPFNNEDLSSRLAKYLISHAPLYFPLPNTLVPAKFNEFLKLLRGLKVQQPDLSDWRQAVLYLQQGEVDEEWAAGLMEKINNEVLVDKKNQQPKALRVNQFFAPLLVKHFDRLLPQLERLLVRSESNIEVWEDFFSSVGQWIGIDPFVVPLLAKIKNLFLNNAEVSIKIAVAVSRRLSDEKHIKDFISFVTALLTAEQNVKRKVIYVRMLKGIIEALQKHPQEALRNILAQELLVVLTNNLAKFNEEQEFNILAGVVESLCPLVSDPKDDIAKAGKLYLKTPNKLIFKLFATIIASIYGRQHAEQLPSVKETFLHFKAQLNAIISNNWQGSLPVLLFLAETDLQYMGNLKESSPLFKASCLALSRMEKRIAVRLILKYIEFVRKSEEEEDEEKEELSDHIYSVLALLLEETKNLQVWDQCMKKLQASDRVKIVSRGIFPLILFPCQELKINKGNNFSSLLLFIYSSLKTHDVVVGGLDYIKTIIVYSKLRPSLKGIRTEEAIIVEDAIKRYVNSSLLGESEEQGDAVVEEREKAQIQLLSDQILTHNQDYLLHLLQQFTNEQYYKKNLDFLIGFEQESIDSLKKVRKQIQELKFELVERSIHRPEDQKPKKVYAGILFEAKMMSEQQVKEEKYRLHFLKMLVIFDKIVGKLLGTLNSHQLLSQLWRTTLKSIMSITKFPEHRLSVQKLVKRSCLFTGWINRKATEARVISRHASFLGEFLAFRHSGITPSVKSMTHCEEFLKELLGVQGEWSLVGQGQFALLLVNEMCEYLLENMEFDVNLKKHAIHFYHKCQAREVNFDNHNLLFTHVARNINILAGSEHIQPVLLGLLRAVGDGRAKELFDDILNYILPTKRLILQTLLQSSEGYRPEFEEYIKLRILSLETNAEISNLAGQLLAGTGALEKSILSFNMKNFVRKNSKQTIEKLCLFIKEELNAQNCEPIFLMVIKASEELFDEGFDQQGLQMFPFFLSINIDAVTEKLYKPIFELLILKFTAKEEFGTLSKLSLEAGIAILKKFAVQHAEKLLLVLESFINKATGVSNIIFLGVLAPYLEGNKNLQMVEKRITELFKSNKEAEQRSIAKCMPDLMSFFKQPLATVESIFNDIPAMPEALQTGQAYLFAGLLKGIGYGETQRFLDRIISGDYAAKSKGEKLGRIWLLSALVQNFGRAVELKGVRMMEILLGYMADNSEEVRSVAKRVGQSLVMRMSSYSVKILLPELLKGLEEEQNWRVKISYIWVLGIMANCSARQLQTSLPIIVPTLSTCLSNAHPTIREKASQALNLIGETIKNPEISQCVDTLIEALENPFENSERALELLLKTSFSHFIDPPSLSMIIPILDYCMRGRVSELKAGACQVIGSIVELIANPYDLLPYLKIIITGLRIALTDPLPEIRSIAAMAIGRIAAKIGVKEAEVHFKFVVEIIESGLSNTTERQGAAQAYAEMICSQSYEYFEESLYKIFEKLGAVRHSEKEGYILVFLYVPSIRTQEFQGFIKEVNENMYCFVSDEEENIRNSAMMVERVLITNYCLSHTDLLLDPLCSGVFENNWKKRNSALILIGEMLNIIKSHIYNTRSNDKTYAYYRALMAVYVIKDDELEMPRLTANQVWNAYIENTPKTIKLGLTELTKMWTRWTHSANGVVFRNIVAFSSKYGENYFPEILEQLQALLTEPDHQVGIFEVLTQFIKRLNAQFLARESFRVSIRGIFRDHLYSIPEAVRPSLARALALFIQKMHQQAFFEELLYSTIDRMDRTDEANEEYTKNLHLLKDLLQTHSNKVVERVISKVMEAPMSEFKIEVITNNAERLANCLYSHFKVPATQLFIEEIYLLVNDPAKENRLSLIIYCLEQVSLHLSPQNKAQFVRTVNSNISRGIHAYSEGKKAERRTLQIFINMLLFFLNSTQVSQMDELESVIGQLAPLVFFDDVTLRSLGHKIFLLLISDTKSPRTAPFIRQMVVSLENNLTSEDQLLWQDEVTFHDYVNMLVKGIAYGREDVMEESLDMVEFLLGHTARPLVEREVLRVVGPIIRVSNYPLLQKQKIRIMELLILILRRPFRIDAYNNQILSVCLRLLQEFRNSQEVVRVVADTYLALLIGTALKQELLLSILARLKTFGANLVHSFYYLVKSIVQQAIQLPRPLLDRIHQDCMLILLSNQGKLPVKGLYYASKIAARVAVLLGKQMDRAEANLKGLVCSYENVLHYLHFAYYRKAAIGRQEAIEVFLKESNRQKIHYLLKSLKLCIKHAESSRKAYSLEYVKSLLPETIIGFDDISDLIDYFESEKVEEEPQEEPQNEQM